MLVAVDGVRRPELKAPMYTPPSITRPPTKKAIEKSSPVRSVATVTLTNGRRRVE
jgi:hypothetical protein